MTDQPAGVTNEMVEAGARAANDAGYAFTGETPPLFFDELSERDREMTRAMVRAALTAALAGRVVAPTGSVKRASRDMREAAAKKVEEVYARDPQSHAMQIRHAILQLPLTTDGDA